ncbi:hypothetical protein HII31_02120 [Pseudocercospora fuligena]|uniref:Matrin-type domain-containing protein n=1 Tax=Pseudocercospora fuligena TaxID=685502 RepID=A0A8H6VN51_9PEZI|nr:hypothetical protein HII31_02120 [Pseudocercospora fuligena]
MAEYWKSTPTYWCKFCSQYVRDTNVEKKNHEASAKHQNNIQRSLRELHKGKEREDREKQRAKDEVARLNGMFGGTKSSSTAPAPATNPKSRAQPPTLNTAQQRKAHAEQLAALGVELPDELKKEVTGVGNYQVVQEREVADSGSISVNRSLAEILAESRREDEGSDADDIKAKDDEDTKSKNLLKRKLEDDEDPRDEEAAPRQKKAWGSNIKSYPGKQEDDADIGDLDALLSGVKKKEPKVEGDAKVKTEPNEVGKALDSVPDIEGTGAAPAVVFKKRKGKK